MNRTIIRRLAAGCLGLALLAGLISAAPARADQPEAADAGAGWISRQVRSNGSVLSPYTGQVDYGQTASAVLALAAAGVGQTQATAATAFLAKKINAFVRIGDPATDGAGQLATLILVADAMGQNPRAFGGVSSGRDLVARLLKTQRTAGADAGLFGASDPTFDGAYRQGLALAALKAAGQTNPAGVTWLRAQQCDDGSWLSHRADVTVACPTADPASFVGADTNSTALAIMGLKAQGSRARTSPLSYLRRTQSRDGGWAYIPARGQASDGNSTALVVQALSALNVDSGALNTRFPSGEERLLALQVGCDAAPADRGAFAFMPFDGAVYPDLFATNQVVPALAGASLPMGPQTLTADQPVLAC